MQNDRELANFANDLSVDHETILFKEYDSNYYAAVSITHLISMSIISRCKNPQIHGRCVFLEPRFDSNPHGVSGRVTGHSAGFGC